MKKVLIVNGHPNKNSFCNSLVGATYKQIQERGDQVQILNLVELKFDPILRLGFQGEQEREPDLIHAQTQIIWADHIVWIYPNWWGGPPALLKGFIDRTLLPGFAFKYKSSGGFPEKLLAGRTAEIVLTLDTPPFFYKYFMWAAGLKVMKNSVLEFCGVKVIKTHLIGPIRGSSDFKRESWLKGLRVG